MHKLYPENNQADMGIAATHVKNEFDFFRSMLSRVVMWSSGSVTQRIPGTIVTIFPPIDVLAIDMILNRCFGDTMVGSIVNES